MSKIFEAFGSQFLPSFPPKDFYEKIDVDDFIIKGIKSELEELRLIREVLRPHLPNIPRTYLLPHQRIDYLINKTENDSKSIGE